MEKMTQTDKTLHQQFVEYGRNAREWSRRCQLLLPEIDRRRIWKKKKCGSLYEYAAKIAGLSRATVDEALWVLKKAEDKPELLKIAAEKGLRRIKPVVNTATTETQSFWAEKAKEMSVHTLETYVRNYREESRHVPEVEPVNFQTRPELAKKFKQILKRQDFDQLLENFLNSIDGGSPAPVKTDSRHIPAAIQRTVQQRTGGLCAYPSCARPATSLHHTQRWGLEKVHDPARLHALCTAHERLAHRGLIENEEKSPANWQLRRHPDLCADKQFIDRQVAHYRPT